MLLRLLFLQSILFHRPTTSVDVDVDVVVVDRVDVTNFDTLLPSTPSTTCALNSTTHHLQDLKELEQHLRFHIHNPINISHTRSILAAIRSQIAETYRSLALAYNRTATPTTPTLPPSNARAYAALSRQSAEYMANKHKELEQKYNHLQYDILPHGHEFNPKLLSDLARVHHQLGHLKESEQYYLKSIGIDGLAANNLGNLLTESRQWKQAKEMFRRGLERKTNVQCVTRHGWSWTTRGDGGGGRRGDGGGNENSSGASIRVHTLVDQLNKKSTHESSNHTLNKTSYIVTLYNVSITGKAGTMFYAEPHTCEIFVGGQRYMHRLRYAKSRHQFVNGNVLDMLQKPLYSGAKQNGKEYFFFAFFLEAKFLLMVLTFSIRIDFFSLFSKHYSQMSF